jgi:hypothetical protein
MAYHQLLTPTQAIELLLSTCNMEEKHKHCIEFNQDTLRDTPVI